MREVIENINKPVSVFELLKRGFFSGIGWAFGATVGFVIVSTILIYVLGKAGGLPVVGNFLASIVQSTLEQLATRTPVFVQQHFMHEEEPGKIKPIGDGVVRRGILFTLDGTSENPEDIAEFELEQATRDEIRSGTQTLWLDEYSRQQSSF